MSNAGSFGGGGSGATNLNGLSDVTIASAAKGDVIARDGTDYKNLGVGADGFVLTADAAEGQGMKWAAAGGGVSDLDDLSDVTIVTPVKGNILARDATDFNNFVVGSDTQILTADSTAPHGIKWDAPASIALTNLSDVVIASPTKGDLVARDGTNYKNIAVGADTFVLTADSAESQGMKWAAAGGGVSELDDLSDVVITSATKGDVLVRTATGFVNLGIGADGQVLTADAASSEGVKWAAAGGGGSYTTFDPLALADMELLM